MKILLISNSSSIFIQELFEKLRENDMNVDLLDIKTLMLLDKNNNEIRKYSYKFNRYKKLSKIRVFFKAFLLSRIIKNGKYNIINIHFPSYIYLAILPYLKKQKLVLTFYGSDFYRTSDKIKNILKRLYKNADILTFTNPMTQQSFIDYYHDFKAKSLVCRFGLKTLDFIDKNRAKDKLSIKEHLGYSKDKIIVTCGYNSTPAQQHEKIIENILKLDTSLLDRIQFIFPMTYGDKTYKEKIKNLLSQTNLDYKVLEDFLHGDDNAYIKLCSDVMINILKTDSFSGSMQEFLYANNIVITGSWLPYKLFDQLGVYYHKIDTPMMLSNKLEEVLINLNKEQTMQNVQIINSLSSWDNNIQSWIEAYEK